MPSVFKEAQKVSHRIKAAEVVKIIVAIYLPSVDRQLLQRRVQVVPQLPLILRQLRSRGQLSVECIAVPGFITDDSRFLIVRQMVLLFEVVPLLIANVRIRRGGLVVGVLELAAVKCHIHRCIVVLALNDIPIIAQQLPHGLQYLAWVAHSVGQLREDLTVAVAGAHSRTQRVLYRPIVPGAGRIPHSAAGIIVQDQVVSSRVDCPDQALHLCRRECDFAVAQGLFDVQIALQQLPAVFLIALCHGLVVGEVESLSLRASVLAHEVSRKFCEDCRAAVVNKFQLPVRIPHFTVLEILLLGLRQLPAGTVPHGVLHLVGRFFLTISNSLAYTINRRLSIGLSAFGGLVDVGM